MSGAPPPAEIAAMLTNHIEALAYELTGCKPTSRSRTELRFRRKGSLAVVVAGSKRGRWYDHEIGTGGDALALVAHLQAVSQQDAYAWARRWLGVERPAAPQGEPACHAGSRAALPASSQETAFARRIWREAVPATGTLVAAYLASRGLSLPASAPLRFHPACPRGAERLPAMLALMTAPETSVPCGVHRTFIRADGSGKAEGSAKMMTGTAGVIRLVPDDDVILGLGLAEGIETSLAVMERTGWRPVWAASSAGAIRRFPVIPGIEALTIFADTDAVGVGAAEDCASRWAMAGREARIITPPSGDWDDATRRTA